MNSETQLRLVFSFLEDIEKLIEQPNAAEPTERTNVRNNLRRALEEVRAIIAQLEQNDPNVTATITKASAERLATLLDARVLWQVTEAMFLGDCCHDYSAAVTAMTRAVREMPENPGVHASLAGYCMLAGDLDAARIAIGRARLLNPGSIEIAKLAQAIEQHGGVAEPAPETG